MGGEDFVFRFRNQVFWCSQKLRGCLPDRLNNWGVLTLHQNTWFGTDCGVRKQHWKVDTYISRMPHPLILPKYLVHAAISFSLDLTRVPAREPCCSRPPVVRSDTKVVQPGHKRIVLTV